MNYHETENDFITIIASKDMTNFYDINIPGQPTNDALWHIVSIQECQPKEYFNNLWVIIIYK